MNKTIAEIKKNEAPSDLVIGQLSEEYINKVNSYGALGYSPERIASMLQLSGLKKDILIVRINSVGDTYNTAYFNGRAIGEYNIDAELAKKAEKGEIDAITMLQQRKDDRNHLDLRRDLLGY